MLDNRIVQIGFTLIELMIVVAIIGILASVALPAYQNYIKKAAFSEVVISMAAVKTAVDVCYGIEDSFDKCKTAADIGEKLPSNLASNGALKEITIDGTSTSITITAKTNSFKGIADDTECKLVATANTGANNLQWKYEGDCVTEGYVRN